MHTQPYRWPFLSFPVIALLTALLAVALTLAACGNDDDDSAPPQPGATSPAASDDSGDDAAGETPQATSDDDGGNAPVPRGSGSAGSITLDGTSYAINQVIRCEPFDDEEGLDLTGLGDGIQVFVEVYSVASSMFHAIDLQGSAVGLYSGSAFSADGENWTNEDNESLDEPPLDWSGNRVTGTLELIEFHEEIDRVTITIDLAVPSDIIEC